MMKHKRSLVTIAAATLVLVSVCAVCVIPLSVSAAGVSRANVQPSSRFTGNGVGADGVGVVGGPAVCSQTLNSVDIFIHGSDNALWWRHWDGTGTGWGAPISLGSPLGGGITSDPAAVAITAGQVEVAARGADGALWSLNTTDGGSTWGAWSSYGGQLPTGTGPATYGWNNSLGYDQNNKPIYDLQTGWIVTGMDHALWWIWTNGTNVPSWQQLGAEQVTSSPAASGIGMYTTNPGQSGVIDIAVRGMDGALWVREYNVQRTSTDFGWLPWFSLGGQIWSGTAPAMARSPSGNGPNQLDVFVKGMDGALWHQRTPSGYILWSGWESLGGYLTSSPGAAWEPWQGPGSYLDVFVKGMDGALWWKWLANGLSYTTWSGWTGVGGL